MSTANNVATKKDLDELRDGLKAELQKYATKDDLKKFATKDDLKKFATKDDLKAFAKKVDLDRVAKQVAINTVEILNIKSELRGVHTKLDFLVEAMSGIAGDLKNNRLERTSISSALDRHENKIENHEIRIRQLERDIKNK